LKDSGLQFSAVRIECPEELSGELNRREPDLVLCDHGSAELDGFGVLELVRARNSSVPFVVVTSSLGESQMAAAMALGADEIVFKNQLRDLAPAIHRAHRLGKMRRRLAKLELQRNRLQSEVDAWRLGKPKLPFFVPICAGCKKIRTMDDEWESMDLHFQEHFNIRFTHGICPTCVVHYSLENP